MQSKPKFIVLDDDRVHLAQLGEMLKEVGIKPFLFRSSIEAIELLDRNKFVGRGSRDFRTVHKVARVRRYMQATYGPSTGRLWIDTDRFNPYRAPGQFLGHMGEVIAGFFRGIFR